MSTFTRRQAASELLRRRQARQWLLDFTQYTKRDYRTNWHHEAMAYYLDGFVTGEIKRLMLFAPPRHGKSELVSRRLPAYLLGRDPDCSVLCCTHTAALASQLNRDVQRIMDVETSEGRLYGQLFPGSRLFGKNIRTLAAGTWQRNSDTFEIVNRKGSYRSSGVGGAIAGVGFHHGIIDDAIRNQESADSEAERETLWEWYLSDFLTRRANDEAGILLTVTRWRVDDLPGRILAQCAADPSLPQWTVVRFPALAEEGADLCPFDRRNPGEALWPDHMGREELEAMRKTLPPRLWAATWQQRPILREGAMFQRQWLSHIVPGVPMAPSTQFVRYWDKGYSSKGDPSCGILMARDAQGVYYVVDRVHGRWSPFERNNVILATAEADRHRYGQRVRVWVEQPPGAGAETTETLLRKLSGFLVKSEKPRGDKAERAEPFADQCEAGNVRLVSARWNQEYVEQLLVFPFGENDEDADASSGAFRHLQKPPPGQPVAGDARGPMLAPGIKLPAKVLDY